MALDSLQRIGGRVGHFDGFDAPDVLAELNHGLVAREVSTLGQGGDGSAEKLLFILEYFFDLPLRIVVGVKVGLDEADVLIEVFDCIQVLR